MLWNVSDFSIIAANLCNDSGDFLLSCFDVLLNNEQVGLAMGKIVGRTLVNYIMSTIAKCLFNCNDISCSSCLVNYSFSFSIVAILLSDCFMITLYSISLTISDEGIRASERIPKRTSKTKNTTLHHLMSPTKYIPLYQA